jgi:urea transport system substrate-binding protein
MTPENAAPARPGGPAPVNLDETTVGRPDTAGDAPRPPGGDPAATWVGKSLGTYQVTGLLGQGGMGVVLQARDPVIERDVAVKVLASHLAGDPVSLDRFLAEARAAGKINHPNVVAIYGICADPPTPHLVLEYVSGGNLGDRLGRGEAYPVLAATRALIDACKGVGAAHAAGIIHRDIKPANFMRASDGSIKVADFGLAKAGAGPARHLTQTGMVVGTPTVMSPEQCEARSLDHRTDVYSLGATYYSLLTGRHPYTETEGIPQLLYMHCHGPVPDPRAVSPAVPEACARIVARAMAKAPADRYQSADEMRADLEAVAATLSGQNPIALPSDTGTIHARPTALAVPAARGPRRVLPAVVGAGIVALVGLGLLAWKPWRAGPADGPPVVGGAPAGEPVKVGVLHSLSGTMAVSETGVVDAVLFALDEVNQEGGVLGRPVKAVVADGRSDRPTFAREAERLITQEQVCTVFGCWTSASRKTVKPVFERHDHLLIYPVPFEGLETSPCVVYLGAAPNQQILPAVRWAQADLGKKRFFLVGSDYVFPRAANAIIKDHLTRSGAELVGEEYVPLGSPNVEAAVAAIARTKPDLILNTINGDSNIAFFRALRAAGVTAATTPTMSFSIGEQGLRTLNAADLEGDYAAGSYFESVASPENEAFVRRFHDKYPQRSISDPMETAYMGVKLWARTANEVQSLDPKKIRRGLLNQTFRGPGGEIRIDPDTQYCERTPRIAQIQPDGRFQVVWTSPAPVRPEPYPNTRTAEAWRAFLHDLYTGWGDRWEATPDK